jgi:hypothetical protein
MARPDKKAKTRASKQRQKKSLKYLEFLPKYTNLSKLTLPIADIIDGTIIWWRFRLWRL